MVYVFAAAAGIVEALAGPIRNLLVFDTAGPDEMTNAVALNALGGNAMRVIGPAIGGALIALVGTEGTFTVQAVCLAVAVLLTAQLHRSMPTGPRSKEGVFASVASGLKYVVRDRRMALIVTMAILPSLLVYPYVTFLPVFATDVLKSDEKAYGYLAAAVGLGFVAGRRDRGRDFEPAAHGAADDVGVLPVLRHRCAFSRSRASSGSVWRCWPWRASSTASIRRLTHP